VEVGHGSALWLNGLALGVPLMKHRESRLAAFGNGAPLRLTQRPIYVALSYRPASAGCENEIIRPLVGARQVMTSEHYGELPGKLYRAARFLGFEWLTPGPRRCQSRGGTLFAQAYRRGQIG
jgi:hypothetical protein